MSLGGVPSSALRARAHPQGRRPEHHRAGGCGLGGSVWPARYGEVIAVGGVNAKDRPWRGSSKGRSVDVGPGEFVLRADARDPADPAKTLGGQGTSFATALLAGVAACWLSHHGRDALIAGLSHGETLQTRFRRLLRDTARVPPGFDTDRYGAGIVDADAFIAADPAAAGVEEAVTADLRSVEREILEIFQEAGAEARAEAAAQAVGDPQSVLELACVAFDMARYRNMRHRSLEAQPPAALSRGLLRTSAIPPQRAYAGGSLDVRGLDRPPRRYRACATLLLGPHRLGKRARGHRHSDRPAPGLGRRADRRAAARQHG